MERRRTSSHACTHIPPVVPTALTDAPQKTHNGLRGGRERFLSHFIFASRNKGIHMPLLHLFTWRGSGKKKKKTTLPPCTKQKTGASTLFPLETREGLFCFCLVLFFGFVVGFSLTVLQGVFLHRSLREQSVGMSQRL